VQLNLASPFVEVRVRAHNNDADRHGSRGRARADRRLCGCPRTRVEAIRTARRRLSTMAHNGKVSGVRVVCPGHCE
jgi:ribosomal protein S14